MNYCAPLGIPHSRFLAWSPDDQDKALMWEREQRAHCQGCGTRHSDWQDDRFAYVAETVHCPGCELLAQERSNISEMEKEFGSQGGMSVVLIPRRLARSSQGK